MIRSSSLLQSVQQFADQPLPPVQEWDPPYCGDMDLRIDRNGVWWHEGREMTRPSLVRLFSRILRKEGDGYFLVSPLEKIGIQVDVAPILITDVDVLERSTGQLIQFTTQFGELLTLNAENPLRVAVDAVTQEPTPYVHVRQGLEGLLHRNVFYRLVAHAVEAQVDGRSAWGVWSAGVFFPLGWSDE